MKKEVVGGITNLKIVEMEEIRVGTVMMKRTNLMKKFYAESATLSSTLDIIFFKNSVNWA
jgi:DNA-binding CsgD family transcriptional regulator